MKKIFTLLLVLSSLFSFSQSTTVVLSQVYGGGGGSTGTYKYDYVELHNVSSTAQVLTGMSIQYGSAAGNFGSVATNIYAFTAGTSIPAGGYLLIQLGAAGTGGADLPIPADIVTTNLAMSAASGKVALANQTAALGCGTTPCVIPSASIIDLVSYGAANNAEGGVSVNNGVALTNVQGCVRKTNGCTETDNNNADFDVITAPVPRNSASPVVTCGAAVPSLSASSLTSFGNVCINTSAGPNSFTITGSNLTTANVDVAVLTGYTYSTTAGGTYTASLSMTQPGGSFSQQVFVKFNPIAVQAYNGNIAVSGGGAATSINVVVTGAGVNSAPSVTTGAVSAITTTTATTAGSITATGCSAITAYGIEFSLTNGFVNGTGTQVASTNLAGGNFTSGLSGLAPATIYYYKAYATNAGGTTYGSQQTFTTANLSPSINTTALTAFGNVCINTTAGPNSFTITGSNLTTANVDVAALPGYTYSTTSGGTYTSSLSVAQPGGSFSQQVFVKFNPTAIQSYNGNIAVTGGGIAAAVNVAAVGAGVNSAPSVTTGAASAITTTAATLAGSITATGCTAVTAYGIEYSLTNGFANGTGTQVASTNVAGGNYTSGLSGLAPGTVYYYKAYATNGAGTAYGTQQSFTTATPPPPALTATALTAFGNVCINTTSAAGSFTINGSDLTAANITVGPLVGYVFSTTSAGVYANSLTLNQTGGTYSQAIFVKFSPVAVQSYNGNIPITGGGTTGTLNVAASGSGVNTSAAVTTAAASNLTTYSATLSGTAGAIGCSPITVYGIEFSSINGFGNGTGTQVVSTSISGSNYYSLLNGLVQGATYYYKAYVINSGGIAYGLQQSFTVPSIANEFKIFPVPAERNRLVRISMNGLTPGYYGLLFFNSAGVLAYQKNINIQANFINQEILVPGALAKGTYRLKLMSNEKIIAAKSILILGY